MQTDRPIELLAGRYALEEELGRSGTGVLWRARDTILDRHVAVKILRPELSDKRAFAERLAREMRIVAGVASPRLAQLLDTGAERGVTFLVREHVPGQSLRRHLQRSGPLPADRAARIVAGALDAIAPAHLEGALHLDLKPANVILTPDGQVFVTDLGVGATVRATCPPLEAAEILSPCLDPPELRRSGSADPRTDVYLAGAVLFEALTGQPPQDERSPRRSVRGTPRALDATVASALAHDPDDRPGSAAAFGAALRAVTDRVPAEHAPRERAPRLGRPGLRGWILVPTLIAVAAIATIVAGLALGRLEFGGPLVVRPAEEPPSPTFVEPSEPASTLLPIVSAIAFDPFGDGTENDSGAPRAIDGDPSTAWRSENYFDGELRKPGVGLLFDLGARHTVTGVNLWTPHAGSTFGVGVGDDPDVLATWAEPRSRAESFMRVSMDPTEGRYVLLWFTSVVDAGDGYRTEVAEFEVIGHDG